MGQPVVSSSQAPMPFHDRRTAILVIHGIGEQDPYEALDSFVRGVFAHLIGARGIKAKLSPIEIAHKDWTQVGMRIAPSTAGALNDAGAEYIDVFEYYWAPATEDKYSAIDTLKWVLRTDFTPLRYFADNLQEMVGVIGVGVARAFWKSLGTYFRELLRVIFLYGSIAVAMGLLLNWLLGIESYRSALRSVGTALLTASAWPLPAILALYILSAMMMWFAMQSVIEMRRYPGKAIEREGDRIWLFCDAILATFFLAAGIFFDLHARGFVLARIWSVISRDGNWQPLLGALLAACVSYALTAYTADVAVYTNMDAKSKDFVARNAILKGSTDALKMLLASAAYDRVILAGHSLGSVIAYDTINELLVQFNGYPAGAADSPDFPLLLEQLQKLRGLITFGCPLDKVYYFFREHVKRNQAIRAQILSLLHSFRKYPSGRDYGEFTFAYELRELDEKETFVWLNAWSRMDPVSAELKFYAVTDQREFDYRIPVAAHLSYWNDPAFYDYFCSKLLLR
jgi:pimeloyl-ACP methyl ester carboxylesterase